MIFGHVTCCYCCCFSVNFPFLNKLIFPPIEAVDLVENCGSRFWGSFIDTFYPFRMESGDAASVGGDSFCRKYLILFLFFNFVVNFFEICGSRLLWHLLLLESVGTASVGGCGLWILSVALLLATVPPPNYKKNAKARKCRCLPN